MGRNCGVLVLLSVLVIAGLCGCASYQKYNTLAKEHDFLYFFPRISFYNDYDTLDEAHDFVRTAQAKFASSARGKPLAKGLPGKLAGPAMNLPKAVRVYCFIFASGESNIINLETSGSAENAVKNAVSATVIFLVYYEDRAISLAGYYLQNGWIYNSASQHTFFTIERERYNADYPLGWTNEKAFRYLRKEID